jgi:hypothetical protein
VRNEPGACHNQNLSSTNLHTRRLAAESIDLRPAVPTDLLRETTSRAQPPAHTPILLPFQGILILSFTSWSKIANTNTTLSFLVQRSYSGRSAQTGLRNDTLPQLFCYNRNAPFSLATYGLGIIAGCLAHTVALLNFVASVCIFATSSKLVSICSRTASKRAQRHKSRLRLRQQFTKISNRFWHAKESRSASP